MSDIDYARDLQQKFQFYLLALAFTILGLAVQTAEFEYGPWPARCEVGAWILLLVSGLAGLSRIEWLPSVYNIARERDLTQYYRMEPHKREVRLRSLETIERQIKRRGGVKYQIHKWGFAAGVAVLALARVLPHGDVLFPTPRAAIPSADQSTPAPPAPTSQTPGPV